MSKLGKKEEWSEKESSYGKVFKVAGPLVVADQIMGAKMYELVKTFKLYL